MKSNRLIVLVLLLCSIMTTAQTPQPTSLRVYEILQSKCVSCHSNADPRAGLDLEGNGANLMEKAADVYQKIVGVKPQNSAANAKGYKHIQPGRIDKSFLFKKINNGLDKTIELEASEESPMPLTGSLTSVEKELIRQWILWGAPKDGEVVSEALLKTYYDEGKGLASFPDNPPAAPAPSEGFQLKMGPFFISPGGETELFLKYQLDNEQPIEVNRISIQMANYSHHFIMYDYIDSATQVPEGLRTSQDHTDDVRFVATVAESRDIQLPNKTAYFWDKNHVLDLNSHYINYSSDKAYQSEVYINVYTQPNGVALQEMHSVLIPNFRIKIPNTGDVITQSANVIIPPGFEDIIPSHIFAWNILGHTHQLGIGYKVWTLDQARKKDELIYDGSCPDGVPGCIVPFFDYQHIPLREFDNFLPLDLEKGLFHEAKYINDGPIPVAWGPTSKDEMMIFGLSYVTDTTGLGSNFTTTTKNIDPIFKTVKVFPNPMQDQATITFSVELGAVECHLYDVLGKEVRSIESKGDPSIRIEKGDLSKGMYWFTLKDKKGRIYSDKILID